MRARGNRVASSPRLMIIPMIDVIFFLLVFFMFSALQMVSQKAMPVNLPQAATVRQEAAKSIAVSLSADGQVSIGEEIVAPDRVTDVMKALIEEQRDRPVILRADAMAEHGKVVAVMDALKSAGVRKLSVAAEEKGR